MAIIMIPNIIYAVKMKNKGGGIYKNKAAVITEQIGRYGCFVFMIFNIPYTYFNFWFSNAFIVYLSVNGILCLASDILDSLRKQGRQIEGVVALYNPVLHILIQRNCFGKYSAHSIRCGFCGKSYSYML